MANPPTTGRIPLWRRPLVIQAVVAIAVLGAIAATTKTVAADDAGASTVGQHVFDAKTYAAEKYDSEVVPAVTDNAVDIATLVPEIIAGPDAAGDKYGHRDGAGAPYAFPVTGSGVAGAVTGTLLPLTITGMPAGVQVMLQIGPAINGTALRDATGLIGFSDFLNQMEYANASTELNSKVKTEVLAGFDAAAAAGKTVTFTGAFAYGTNTAVLQVTPVKLEVAP